MRSAFALTGVVMTALSTAHCGLTEPSAVVMEAGSDGHREAGRDVDTGATHDSATLRDAAQDTGATPDVATCGTPFDATMPLPDGGVCTVGTCDRWGMECCPGFECAVCPIAIGDGSYVFDREAGPFYCNVTMR